MKRKAQPIEFKIVSGGQTGADRAGLDWAIANWREVQHILRRMQVLSRQVIFGTLPDTRRRKPLTKDLSGLNQVPFETPYLIHPIDAGTWTSRSAWASNATGGERKRQRRRIGRGCAPAPLGG